MFTYKILIFSDIEIVTSYHIITSGQFHAANQKGKK
jgi:hypothetical protein